MALLVKRLIQNYYRSMTEYADPRTKDWFLVKSPIPFTFISVLYFLFVLEIGPKFMAKRKAFNLDKLLILYNSVQVILNGYIVIEGFSTLFELDYRCAAVEYSYGESPMKMARLTWLYYMIKILDLFDTVFFVLRKKHSHVSFLHVYHHFGVGFVGWFGTKFLAGGHSIYLGYINSIVHVIMYSYYLLTVVNKEYSNNASLKKRVTQVQLIQFMALLLIYTQLLFRKDCGYPAYAIIFYVPQNLIMLILFGDFYYKTYISETKQ